jgi:hypothetical protein
MKSDRDSSATYGYRKPYLRRVLWIFALTVLIGGVPARPALEGSRAEKPRDRVIPAAEFSRIVREFSEEGGYFRSDNLVSNETAYLYVVDLLNDSGISGGAYLGVGPEQNFTYIAKVRPRIAFIVDIRRQAIIQHLMFKALFRLAETRAKFLSLLFSKPLAGSAVPGPDASAEDLVAYFSNAASDGFAYRRNLAQIQTTITREFRIPIDEKDQASLEYVYGAFRDENLDLRYQSGGFSSRYAGYGFQARGPWGYFPSLRDLILERDQRGRLGNFLASRNDYEFLRSLHESNRIIPIVGDFAGKKALAAVAAYLKENGYTVTAFYTSNVEQYLFRNGGFDAFAKNVAALPMTGKSLFIRAYPNNQRMPHPAQAASHRLTTLLQRMAVFVDDYRQGLYTDYWTLVTTHYLAPQYR